MFLSGSQLIGFSVRDIIYTQTKTQYWESSDASANLSSGSGNYIAQSFTITTLDRFSKVGIKTGVSGGGANTFNISIEADSAGAPSGTPLAIASSVTMNNTSTVNEYTLDATYIPLTTFYWLVVRHTAGTGVNNLLAFSNTTGGYSGGNFRSTALGNLDTSDLYFRVYQDIAS